MAQIRILVLNSRRARLANNMHFRPYAKSRSNNMNAHHSSANSKAQNGSVQKVYNLKNLFRYITNRLKFAFIARFFTARSKPLIVLPLEMTCECPKPETPGTSKSPEKHPHSSKDQENEEIEIFREYLRIPSVHPNPNYAPCIEFLEHQARRLNLPVKIYYPANKMNPLLIMTWEGTDPSLPAILLSSHMDVVPVVTKSWTHPPFAAEMDKEGRIFARGAQDMKCVGMQYLGAIRALKKSGHQFKRTIHIAFVPDEELGGRLGMRAFVPSANFKALNVGFALDEGSASPTDEFPVYYAERSIWRVHFTINGTGGHGSLLLKNTPGEKLLYIVNKFMDMREQEVRRLQNNPNLTTGDVTTINFTRLSGGVQTNVVPHQMHIGFDVRLAIDVDQKKFEEDINRWCTEAGGDVQVAYEQKRPHIEPTKIDDSNPYWLQFKGAIDELGLKIKPLIFPGGSDSRYIREIGIPAIGFSPMNNTPVLLHDHDEFIRADTYLRGIEIYKKIIAKVANTKG